MRNTKRLEIGDAVLEVPFYYDKRSKMDIERYPNLIRHPVYTPEGYWMMLTIEDACPQADLQPGVCQDCGSCNHYTQLDDTWIGVCHSPAMRRQENMV